MIDLSLVIFMGESVNFIGNIFQRRNRLEAIRRDPGFNPGAAPIGTDQANRDIQFRLEAKGEKVTHRREISNRLRRANFPAGTVHVLLGFVFGIVLNFDVADLGMIAGGNFRRGIVGTIDGPFHVGLARTEPHLTHENIFVLGRCCSFYGKG